MNKYYTKNSMEKMELSMDALDHISGGYFTEDAEEYLCMAVGDYKKRYRRRFRKRHLRNPGRQLTMDQTVHHFLNHYDELMVNYPYVTREELQAYIIDNWDFL